MLSIIVQIMFINIIMMSFVDARKCYSGSNQDYTSSDCSAFGTTYCLKISNANVTIRSCDPLIICSLIRNNCEDGHSFEHITGMLCCCDSDLCNDGVLLRSSSINVVSLISLLVLIIRRYL